MGSRGRTGQAGWRFGGPWLGRGSRSRGKLGTCGPLGVMPLGVSGARSCTGRSELKVGWHLSDDGRYPESGPNSSRAVPSN